MKKVIIMVITMVMVAGNIYGEVFCGSFSGNDFGYWGIYYDSNSPDDSYAIAWSTVYKAIDFGYVIYGGTTIAAVFDSGITFNGEYDEDTEEIEGTWSSSMLSGSVEGQLVESADIVDYMGEYVVYSSEGDEIEVTIYGNGKVTAALHSDDVITPGEGVVDVDGNVYIDFDTFGTYGSRYSGYIYNVISQSRTTYSRVNSQTDQTYLPLDDEESGCFIFGLHN